MSAAAAAAADSAADSVAAAAIAPTLPHPGCMPSCLRSKVEDNLADHEEEKARSTFACHGRLQHAAAGSKSCTVRTSKAPCVFLAAHPPPSRWRSFFSAPDVNMTSAVSITHCGDMAARPRLLKHRAKHASNHLRSLRNRPLQQLATWLHPRPRPHHAQNIARNDASCQDGPFLLQHGRSRTSPGPHPHDAVGHAQESVACFFKMRAKALDCIFSNSAWAAQSTAAVGAVSAARWPTFKLELYQRTIEIQEMSLG